jgi:hypothetical protein
MSPDQTMVLRRCEPAQAERASDQEALLAAGGAEAEAALAEALAEAEAEALAGAEAEAEAEAPPEPSKTVRECQT